jgi:hypothetical protein
LPTDLWILSTPLPPAFLEPWYDRYDWESWREFTMLLAETNNALAW